MAGANVTYVAISVMKSRKTISIIKENINNNNENNNQ